MQNARQQRGELSFDLITITVSVVVTVLPIRAEVAPRATVSERTCHSDEQRPWARPEGVLASRRIEAGARPAARCARPRHPC